MSYNRLFKLFFVIGHDYDCFIRKKNSIDYDYDRLRNRLSNRNRVQNNYTSLIRVIKFERKVRPICA